MNFLRRATIQFIGSHSDLSSVGKFCNKCEKTVTSFHDPFWVDSLCTINKASMNFPYMRSSLLGGLLKITAWKLLIRFSFLASCTSGFYSNQLSRLHNPVVMDMRRMSNWNVLSVEAALQQLNAFEGDDPEKIIRRPNTVSVLLFCSINNLSRAFN